MNVYLLASRMLLSYDVDWMEAYAERYGQVRVCRLLEQQPDGIEGADLICLMHSTSALGVEWPDWLYRLDRRGKIVMFTGNDYKHFAEKQAAADRLRVDLLATLAPGTPYETGNGIERIEHIPHALNPQRFIPVHTHQQRPISIGFRGFKYPLEVGDQERNDIVRRCGAVEKSDCDFSIFRDPADYQAWLNLCRATCATEAGMVGRKAVSSRHFESIGSGAALLMHPGEFSGCLGPEHYFSVERDFSDLSERVEQINDPAEWGKVVTAAHNHCVENHTYDHRLATIEEMLWPSQPSAR